MLCNCDCIVISVMLCWFFEKRWCWRMWIHHLGRWRPQKRFGFRLPSMISPGLWRCGFLVSEEFMATILMSKRDFTCMDLFCCISGCRRCRSCVGWLFFAGISWTSSEQWPYLCPSEFETARNSCKRSAILGGWSCPGCWNTKKNAI